MRAVGQQTVATVEQAEEAVEAVEKAVGAMQEAVEAVVEAVEAVVKEEVAEGEVAELVVAAGAADDKQKLHVDVDADEDVSDSRV